MPQNTNVNNNAAVVVVGRTAPVPTGQQSADKSIPVVVASDQEAIPVEEQNKQQSEVALSLLGIPRSEVALGIFADVNTYDVNPSEWSATPEQTTTILPNERVDFTGIGGEQDWGLSHVPAEAGALIEAPPTETAILTSKRFFRYQPGRVSAGTFGVKFGPSPYTTLPTNSTLPEGDVQVDGFNFQVRHPTIKKYGVFDNFDGYYYESINESLRDNFCCVRRTQSLIQQKSQYFFFNPDTTVDNVRQYGTKQYDDYGNMELPGQYYKYHGDAVILRDGLVNIHAGLFDPSLLKKKRDIGISSIAADPSNWIEMDTVEQTITGFSYNNETGRATVTTAGDHGYKNGDSVTLKDILLECNTGQKLYPNKYSRKIFQVESISANNNYTIHVGISDKDGQPVSPGITFTNTSLTGGTIREITASSNGPDLPITAIDRTSVAELREVGLLEITVDTNHNLKEGDHVQWTESANWSNSVVYPNISATTAGRTQQKFFQVRYVKNSETFTIQIGDPAFSELDVNEEWTSGGKFQKVNSFTKNDPTNISTIDSYNASTGKMVINAGGAIDGLAVGDFVELADIKTECTYGDKTYPAKDDEETFPIINVTSNTFQFELFTSTIVHTHKAAGVTGRTSNLGLRKGSGVYYYKNGQTTDGAVDGGIYYVRDILGKRIKLSKVPDNGLLSDSESGVFASDKIGDVSLSGTNQEYKLTPTTSSTYNPTTGLFQFNIATAHGLVTGDKIRIDDFSIGIECSTAYANSTAYSLGDFVRVVDNVYEVVTAGTSAASGSGPTGTGTGITDGTVVFDFKTDEPVKYYPRPYNASPAAGLPNKDPAAGKFLNVTVVDANNFTVQVLPQTPSSDQNASNIVYVSQNSITVEKFRPYIVTPAPFILPDTESNKYIGTYQADDKNKVESGVPFGCFPYKYSDGSLSYGYIDTDVVGNTLDGSTSLRTEIDFVNNKLLKDWVYNHVDPQYWTVYEYKVPRSRFSGEKVDGQEDRDVLYSDVVYSAGQFKFPGEDVTDPATGSTLTRTSNWNLNPQNVTMYKIEFSWYGAVGALFLAYVPLDNGEARWVRVHHLRASNQLKVSSLGNPTLPITYLVYGGGTERSFGYINSRKTENYIANSSSYSEFIVKYGASYYIDGGDRGTVRLFNYATPTQESVYGNKLRYNLNATNNQFGAGNDAGGDPLPHLVLTGGGATRPVANNDLTIAADAYTIFMGATVVTPNREPNVKVVWVDGSAGKIYLSRPISTTQASTQFDIILDRPKLLMGLKCREEVNSVRNRIQVYPTRLSIGNAGDFATIKLVKSPKFQTKDTTTGNFNTTYTLGEALNIGSIGKPTALNATKVDSGSVGFLEELGSTFGYFRGFFEGNSTILTIFGKLSRDASGIYSFSAEEKTNANVLIYGDFLKAGEYLEPNPTSIDGSNIVPTDTALAPLSAIAINTEQRTPIPGTGQQITTLYTASNSGEQFELQQFFDYNKDYLSFPLTNEIETLYIAASENSLYDSSAAATTITAALTWEEQ